MSNWMNKDDLIKWLEEGNGYGNVHFMEEDKPIALKITKLPDKKPKASKPEEMKGQWYTEYKDGDKKIPLTPITSSASAVDRFLEKYKDEEIVGRYAVFSKTTYNGKKVHSINLIKNKDFEPSDTPDVIGMLKAETSEPVQESIGDNVIQQFVTGFKEAVATNNAIEGNKQETDSLANCAVKFFMKFHLDEFTKLRDHYISQKTD